MPLLGGQRAREDEVAVLIVDDDPGVASLVGTYLERADDRFATTAVTDSEDGLERLADDAFDCVVSDYHMPGMDGLAFLEAVAECAPDATRILYTGDDDPSVCAAARDGDVEYMHKHLGSEQGDALAAQIRQHVDGEHGERDDEGERGERS